jgi:hypothetical protein
MPNLRKADKRCRQLWRTPKFNPNRKGVLDFMDNSKIISATVKFKNRLRTEIEENLSHSEDMKFGLWKINND